MLDRGRDGELVVGTTSIAFPPGTEDNWHHSPKGCCSFQASPMLVSIPSAGRQESPGKGKAQSQVGGSLRVLDGPFNLGPDPCQCLELRRQHPAAKLHGMSSARHVDKILVNWAGVQGKPPNPAGEPEYSALITR